MTQAAVADGSYHFPPDVFALLTDAIPALCRSKRDVLLFFVGAGVPAHVVADFETALSRSPATVKKHEIARTVLQRLNEAGEPMLAQRREVLKRVVETETFSTCWPDDVYKAKGLVADLRQAINAKDSFTRMKVAHDRERSAHIQEQQAKLDAEARAREARLAVSQQLAALFSATDPWKRAKQVEGLANQLFALDGLSVRDAFTVTGDESTGVIEQIDGAIEMDGHIYLVEVKWLSEAVGVDAVSAHLVRVYSRGDARGLFISATQFTDGAIAAVKTALAQRVCVLCTLDELVLLLENGSDLRAFLREKVRMATLENRPYHRPSLT